MAGGATGKVKTEAGKVFTVTLPENPSTGYAWQLAAPADGVTIVDSRFEQQDQGDRVGVPGLRVFKLTMSKPLAREIVFEKKRAWETEAVERHTVVIVAGEK